MTTPSTPEQQAGQRLASARKMAGYRTQEQLGDRIGVSARQVRNWETGKHPIAPDRLIALRELLGNFDAAGDAVEVAIRQSELTEDRQDTVVGFYKRNLREQREEQSGRGMAG